MDINDLRVLTTLIMFLVFIGIVVWAWAARRQAGFAEAAQLPFADPEFPADNPPGEQPRAGAQGVQP
jgi:cytochrome c oxidase cbb3-type subunit IV